MITIYTTSEPFIPSGIYIESARGKLISLQDAVRTMEAGIGLLCLLYIDGKINLCVNNAITHVQRFANTDKEYDDYITQHFKQSKK